MTCLKLRISNDTFTWPLPDELDEVTSAGLKEEFKERFKLLYHQKLRFFVEGPDQLDDAANVPLSPAVVKVKGPESVLKMLDLALRKHASHSSSEPAAQKTSLQQAYPMPKVRPVAPPQSMPLPAASLPQGGYGSLPGSILLPGSRGGGAPAPRVADQRGNPGGLSPPLGSYSPDLHPATSNTVAQQAVAAQQQLAMARQLELEQQDFDSAIQASRMMIQMDEEAQLAWALAESTRQAEVENLAKMKAQAPSEHSSTREPSSVAVPWDTDEDNGDESDDDDDDLPPLAPLPNSEE